MCPRPQRNTIQRTRSIRIPCHTNFFLRTQRGPRLGWGRPDRSLRFLRMGRLVRIQGSDQDWGWGVVLKTFKLQPPPAQVRGSHHATLATLLRPACA